MFENIPNLLMVAAAVGVVGFVVFNAIGGGASAEDAAEVRQLLAADEAELIDVRTPREFATNGLTGARNIPVQHLKRRFGEVGPKERPVVVYCRSGSRSGHAAGLLKNAGFTTVYDLGALGRAREVVEGK